MSVYVDVGHQAEIPLRGARRIQLRGVPVGIFRSGSGEIFALLDECPHKKGRLSDGIVHGHAVACPLHNWNIDLKTGEAHAPDKGCTAVIGVCVKDDRVLVDLDTLPIVAA